MPSFFNSMISHQDGRIGAQKTILGYRNNEIFII